MFRSASMAVAGVLLASAALAAPFDHGNEIAQVVRTQAQPTGRIAERGNLVQMLNKAGDYKTFVALIGSAGLDGRLEQGGPYTVFAPTDEAFDALPAARLADLRRPDHRVELQNFVSYHIVPGEITGAKMSGMQTIPTLQGSDLTIQATMEGVLVNGATLIKGDMLAANGVVHGVSAVLMPSTKTEEVAGAN
jgi:uncharacterized surface protein with fasciclin (FAS1) repeats